MTESSDRRADVRMRGFASRSLVAEAWQWVDKSARSIDAESVSIDDATGRVLSEPIAAPIDVPAFDRSAMDGFALRGSETTGASEYNPIIFEVVGESLPGQPWPSEIQAGTAVRIMTGAPVPAGADAVLPAEFANHVDHKLDVTTAIPPGKHIGRQGEDILTGRELFGRGRRLRPQDSALLASVGKSHIDVIRRPQVRLLVTGNELVEAGRPRTPYQIYDSNSVLLRPLVERDGGQVTDLRRLPDTADAIRDGLLAPGVDVVLVSGGSSVGAEDFAPILVAEHGSLDIHGVAMRPSSPAGMGRVGEALVFLLPGNPVACLCAYDFFAGRAIRLMSGRSPDWPYASRTLPVARKIVSAIGRTDYVRVQLAEEGIIPLAVSGASILSTTTRADGFVIVPNTSEGLAVGTEATVLLYDAP